MAIDKHMLKSKIEERRQLIWPKNTGRMDIVDVPKPLEQGWLNALKWVDNLIEGLDKPDEEQFKQYVLRELDSCGYFMADLDANFIQKINPDWKPYSSKSFGEMLLDFACQYNMEHGGKNYEYKLVEE